MMAISVITPMWSLAFLLSLSPVLLVWFLTMKLSLVALVVSSVLSQDFYDFFDIFVLTLFEFIDSGVIFCYNCFIFNSL